MAEDCENEGAKLRGSPQLQPSSAKFEVESPIILHVDFPKIALKNVKFADISLVGDHILAVSFSSVAEFFQKLDLLSLEDFSRSFMERLVNFCQTPGNLQSSRALLPFQTTCKDTFRSAAVVLCIKLRSKAILAQGLPPSYDEQKATSVSALHASHVSIQPYLKDSLKESAREDSQYCKLLYTLKQDFPFTLKQREKLMSLAVVGGYTDIVELLSRREICVSDIHFKLAAKYGRVHTARLLMKLRWNSDLLRAEAEDYGNNAIVNNRCLRLISRNDMSRRYFSLLSAISMGGKIFANDIEDKAARVELVKTVTSLLATGTPLEFCGSFIGSALLLAISTNSTPLLPLLLAAGAPLTATTSGLGPLQLAWVTPGVTPWVSVVVARAIRLKLRVEMDFSPENPMEKMLKSGISDLLQHLEGVKPWKAKFNSAKNNPKHLTQLLVTACKRGATTSAWWVWQAGGSPASPVPSVSALQAALNPEQPHLDTARALIIQMGSNPFLPGEDGSLLFSNMPVEFRKQLLQDSLVREHRCLYMKMAKERHHRNRQKVIDLQRLIVLQILLYILYEMRSEGTSYPSLQDLLTCSELGLTGNQEEELHVINEEWITSLIRKLDADCEGKNTSGSLGKDEEDEFYELSECIRLFSKRKRKSSEYSIKHKHECLDLLYKKALMMCSEENLTAFLYLLVSVAGVHANEEVDPICGTQALHHAAMHGNLSIAMSLVCFGCSKKARDHGRNTPAHYAFMAGHEEVAQFLTDGIENEVNSRELRPYDMFEGYNTYLEQQSLTLLHRSRKEQEIYNDGKTLTERHLQHLRETWEANGGLIKTIKDIHVDFTKGESFEIKQAITRVAEDLISEIAKVNKFFEGDLVGVGSAADDTRLFCPDEYDFNLVLRNMSGHPGGGLKIELQNSPESERVQKDIALSAERDDLENLMDGSNFIDTFYNTAKDCLKNLRLDDERLIFISAGIKSTQIGINLRMAWMGQEFPLLMIDVDIVPTVEAPWPQHHPQPPLTPSDTNTVFLSNTTRKEWRFSFGAAENHIMRKLSNCQRRVFLGCKLLLSSLKVSWWMPNETKRQFTFWDKKAFRLSVPAGFVLKNVFFEELEDVQDADLWTDDHLLDRMKSVFGRMCADHSDPKCQMPRKVMAYFGGDTQLPSFARGAPDILTFLRSLDAVPIQPSSKVM
ncbi:uncharacterized protein [Penaeus vannamei]|uniref:uncharacterized protein isoform X2 n=1 Tax=Penaeus vannamei TaxID=6689 RepID=UPI00387F7EC0